MKNISNLVLKILLKSIILLIMIVVINYHFIQSWKFYFEKQEPFLLFFHMRSYTCRTITLFMVITIIYYINMHYDEIKLLARNEFIYFLGVVYGVLKFIFIICMVPIIYMIAYSILKGVNNFNIVIEFLKMLFYEWVLPISAVGITTGFISIYIKNKILKYILSGGIFYITSSTILLYSIGSNNNIYQSTIKYVSLFSDMAYAKISYCFGIAYDLAYILDKVACIIIIFLCISLAYIISMYNSKKRILLSLISCTLCILVSVFIIYAESSLVTYSDEDIKYQQQNQKINYFIKNYNMNLDFKTYLSNNVNIKLDKKSGGEIKFYLDDIFKIKEVSINNKTVKYNHKDNVLTIFCDKNSRDLSINIKYKGFVHVITTWYKYMYIANSHEIMLPEKSIAWYPKPINKKTINFNLNISSKNKVYCNLKQKYEENKINQFKYIGKAEDLFIYSGIYNEKTIDGIKYIWPQDLNLKNELSIQGLSPKEIKKMNNITTVIFGRRCDYNFDEKIDNGILCLSLE